MARYTLLIIITFIVCLTSASLTPTSTTGFGKLFMLFSKRCCNTSVCCEIGTYCSWFRHRYICVIPEYRNTIQN
uniref:Cysteine rich secreted protein n=1 Tax=Riptortus pedestris TaxID=329032 RepID=R4WMY0_RIPPE|nr:cysteine rich secreted protein [Riptortus pedestris]